MTERLFSSDLKTKSRRTLKMHKNIEARSHFKMKSLIAAALTLVGALLVATIACGGSETVIHTVEVEKSSKSTARL